MEKLATSFYISNIPNSVDPKGLWKICAPYGTIVLDDQDLVNVEDPSMVLLGPLDRIQFPSSSSADNFQTNASLKSVYSCIKIATPSFKVDERMIWIEIRGLPLCAWGSNAYNKVADMFDKFMFFEAEESTEMNSGRICISTKSHNFVSERALVEVHGVEDSVDENSLADLNNLNDLKETINELARNEIQHPISKDNMDQEDDINKVTPKIAVFSNLSRPPGFEHMKRTTSKCSTSFARYRKKEIKGVFLIEELSRSIEVRDSLGFDVRGMACGRSSVLISMWDPNSFIKDNIWGDDAFIIVKEHWRNTVGDCYMINIYGPQDSLAKAILWNRIGNFMHQHVEEVAKALPDVRVTTIDRLWSDHNPILLHVSKSDFGPMPFKLFHSLLLRDSFDEVIKTELPKLEEHNFGRKLLSHEKFRLFKARIKQWYSEIKTPDRVTKHDNLQLIKSIEEKIKAVSANDDDHDSRIKLL
ncbi:hypothetical protein Tco_0270004 [Tanacetum coccineum]